MQDPFEGGKKKKGKNFKGKGELLFGLFSFVRSLIIISFVKVLFSNWVFVHVAGIY